MKLIEKQSMELKAFCLGIPGDHDLFGRFERMMRDNFVFNEPNELPLRIFKPVSKDKYGFNLVFSILKIEISKYKSLVKQFCQKEDIDFRSLSPINNNQKI